jgi:hypothetical protein
MTTPDSCFKSLTSRSVNNPSGYLVKLVLILLSLFLYVQPGHAANEDTITLTVKKGDNLIHICRTYLEDPGKWGDIAKINRRKNPNLIHPGEELLVPTAFIKGTPLISTVTFKNGDVQVQAAGKGDWVPLNLGDKVLPGSRIKTHSDSSVEVSFEDGSSFFLKPNTELGLATAQKKITSQWVRYLFLQLGRAITKVQGITGADPRFKIQTPSSIASVRGTEFRVAVDPEQKTLTEVLNGRVAVDAMEKRVELKGGEGTMVKKGQPPLEPRKLLPPPELLDVRPAYNIPLRFTFKEVPGASSFRIRLAKDKEARYLILEKVIKVNETLKIRDIGAGSYFLVTQSIDDIGLEGPESEPYAVNVRVNPQPPFISEPREGAELRGESAEFKWLKVSDGVKYHVQVAEDKEFERVVEDRNDVLKGSYQTGTLHYKAYYFRVSSIAADGFEGSYSDHLSFSLKQKPPAASPEKPKIDKESLNLRWRNAEQGFRYHFQMARDEKFKDILVDRQLDQPEVTLKKPGEPGTYYVRTSTIESTGYEGDFSPPQSFEIEPKPPRTPWEVLGIWGTLFLLLHLVL